MRVFIFILIFSLIGFPLSRGANLMVQEEANFQAEEVVSPSNEEKETQEPSISEETTREGARKEEGKEEEKEIIIPSLTFKNTDIKTFLRAIAKIAKVNIIAGPNVVGTITVSLENISWHKALDATLKAHGYGYYEIYPKVFLVDTLENLAAQRQKESELEAAQPLVMRSIPLTFLKAQDAQMVVENFLSPRGKIVVDTYSNSLVIIDLEDNINKIEEYLKKIDRKIEQVLLDVKIIEVSLNDLNKLGVKWQVSAEISGAKGDTSFPFKTNLAGVSRFFRDFFSGAPSPDSWTYGTLSAASTTALLDIIFSQTKGKIISQPRIMVLNHKDGFIEIKTKEPIEYASIDPTTGTTIYTVEEKEYGVSLKVTPHINKDRFITLELEPVVSDKLRDKSLAHSGTVPVISTHTAKTTVLVKDRDTLVIGGVIKKKEDITEQKIPFLGDIPVLGMVFRYNSRDDTRDEILIFITPHIVD